VADFRTHIAASSIVGVAYGYTGYRCFDFEPNSCIVAAGLCGVAGMLPDLDSSSGVPLRELTTFSAAIIPMLMADRFRQFGWQPETLVLAAGVVYLGIRFGVAEFFRRFTVHRGMWHSLPAAAICGLASYLFMHCLDERVRLFKSLAVVTGFLVHLVLDEIWAVDYKGGGYQVKRSFGTAMKLWGSNRFDNILTYMKLGVLGLIAYQDHHLMERFAPRDLRNLLPYKFDQTWRLPSLDHFPTLGAADSGETTDRVDRK
jgi:hypothetical protein